MSFFIPLCKGLLKVGNYLMIFITEVLFIIDIINTDTALIVSFSFNSIICATY